MSARKILFDQEHDQFMKDYKEVSGMSIQKFVTNAVKEYVLKLKAEQAIKDVPFQQPFLVNPKYSFTTTNLNKK